MLILLESFRHQKSSRMWYDCMDTYLEKAARNKQRACKKQEEELRQECHVTNQKLNLSWELLKHAQAWTLCALSEIIETCRLKDEEKVVTICYEEKKIWEESETDVLECMVSKSAPRNSSYNLKGNSTDVYLMLCAHQKKVQESTFHKDSDF